MIRALMLLPLVLAADSSGEKLFGDWAVACDNVKRCEAVSLMPPEAMGDDPVPVKLSRDAGPMGAITITIDPQATAGRAMIEIDGRPVTPAVLMGDGITLTGSAAEGLARAMATGRRMTVRDYHEKRVATISLKGSSAMLRWIDSEQGRAGTLTALVAKGTKPVAAVPRAAPLPSVPALRAPKGAATVPAELIAAIAKQSECDEDVFATQRKAETAKLDGRNTLVLIPCGSGAYNFNSLAFIVSGGKARAATFDIGPDGMAESPILTNAGWDDGESRLHHYAKGRGLGDCGTAQDWVWDGTRFRLIFATQLGECRGAIDWPVTYRAMPVWR